MLFRSVAIAIAFAAGAHDVAPLPPAILIALWIPLGVSLLRQTSTSRRTQSLPIPVTT